MEPAKTVIDKLGGAKAVACGIGVDLSRVHRWTYPKSRGGTGGLIPTQQQPKLLALARKLNVELSGADLIAEPVEAGDAA